jgi:hypothetical protein
MALTVFRRSLLILSAFAAIACVVLGSVGYDDLSVVDVFFGYLFSGPLPRAVFWPRSGRAERVESELERMGWADRVDLPAGPAGQASARSATHASKAF